MKFAVKCLSVLAAAGLLAGAMAATPAIAKKAKPKAKETDIIKQWDADWKKFDKEVAGWFEPEKKKK